MDEVIHATLVCAIISTIWLQSFGFWSILFYCCEVWVADLEFGVGLLSLFSRCCLWLTTNSLKFEGSDVDSFLEGVASGGLV